MNETKIVVAEAGHGRDEQERIWPTPQTMDIYRSRFPDDWVRYEFASRFVPDKRVMDCACGAGYGSWLLKRAGASSVIGIDVSTEANRWAKTHFAMPGIDFRLTQEGRVPVETGSVDCVISLETIEHVPAPEEFVAELARVLVPGGLLVLSTPLTYGAARLKPSNRFHLREFDDQELAALLEPQFAIRQRLGQHSAQAARFATLKRAPAIGRLIRAGAHRLLPAGARAIARALLNKGADSQVPWITESEWKDAPVQIVVGEKRC